jgi:hypothetical protein
MYEGKSAPDFTLLWASLICSAVNIFSCFLIIKRFTELHAAIMVKLENTTAGFGIDFIIADALRLQCKDVMIK